MGRRKGRRHLRTVQGGGVPGGAGSPGGKGPQGCAGPRAQGGHGLCRLCSKELGAHTEKRDLHPMVRMDFGSRDRRALLSERLVEATWEGEGLAVAGAAPPRPCRRLGFSVWGRGAAWGPVRHRLASSILASTRCGPLPALPLAVTKLGRRCRMSPWEGRRPGGEPRMQSCSYVCDGEESRVRREKEGEGGDICFAKRHTPATSTDNA